MEIRGRRSRKDFGADLKIHRNTIERYEKGERPIPNHFLQLVIEKNPGWSLAWLMNGHLPKREAAAVVSAATHAAEPAAHYGASIDDQLLAEVMQEIEAAFGKNYMRVTVEKRAALIAAVYDDARPRGKVSRDTVLRLIKLATYP
jgi:hypothetical protein